MKSLDLALVPVIAQLEAHTQSCIKRFLTQQSKELKILCELNGGIEPTIDNRGRFHAKVDGYLDSTGKVYNKGWFIPMPGLVQTDNSFYSAPPIDSKAVTRKILIMDEIIDRIETDLTQFKSTELMSIRGPFNYDTDEYEYLEEERDIYKLDGIILSLGQKWENKIISSNGKKNAYLYIKGASNGYLNIIYPFFQNLVEQVKQFNNSVIEKQKEEAKAKKGIAPTGKQEVTGKIIGLPIREGFYGTEFKMMVELENLSTVFGTLPSSLEDAKVGDVISFKGTFTQAQNDKTHAFFKRPSQAKFA